MHAGRILWCVGLICFFMIRVAAVGEGYIDSDCLLYCPPGSIYFKAYMIEPISSASMCQTYNPNMCPPCSTKLIAGNYWTLKETKVYSDPTSNFFRTSTCSQEPCAKPDPGWYYTARCGEYSNAVIKQCVFYRNNPQGPDSRNPGLYYCPGGESDPVRIPDNSKVNGDFTGFTCNAGYYLVQQSCVLCPVGKYCVGGVATPCKKHYYSDEPGSTRCTRCKRPIDCTGSNCGDSIAAVVGNTECGIAPTLCAGGSIQNSNCVSCGLCGTSPQTGVECVNEYEMDGLPGFDPVS